MSEQIIVGQYIDSLFESFFLPKIKKKLIGSSFSIRILYFFCVLYHSKLIICEFWTVVQTKQDAIDR